MTEKTDDQHADLLGDLLAGEDTVLLDFWAEWCQPCQMIAPLIDETARQRNGELAVVKVNIDERPEIASLLAVRSIPTLILFRHGSEVARYSGVMNKLRLNAWLGQSDKGPAV